MVDFCIGLNAVRHVGDNFSRPECILAERDGTLWVSDNRGTFTHVSPDGRQTLLGSMGGKPNGMALGKDGCIYMANIAHRKFYRVQRDGRHEVFLDSVNDMPVGAANFVLRGPDDRLWLSVSTRIETHLDALERDVPDGYVIRIDDAGRPEIVVDGLLFTNEMRISADEKWLCMAETRGGRVARAPLRSNGTVGPASCFGASPLGERALTDGVAFDSDGNLWVTDIVGNRIFVIDPDGSCATVLEDPEGKVIDHPSSITFAGDDLKTVLVGSLTMSKLATFRSPIAGAPMRHWNDPPYGKS